MTPIGSWAYFLMRRPVKRQHVLTWGTYFRQSLNNSHTRELIAVTKYCFATLLRFESGVVQRNVTNMRNSINKSLGKILSGPPDNNNNNNQLMDETHKLNE